MGGENRRRGQSRRRYYVLLGVPKGVFVGLKEEIGKTGLFSEIEVRVRDPLSGGYP